MIGNTLDSRYKVIEKLKDGGFGETYIAEDIKKPSSPLCVVKRLKPSEVNSITVDLFRKEAKILETLGDNHSQIPTLFAYFEKNTFWGDTRFFIVQEYIKGDSFHQFLKRVKKLNEYDLILFIGNILEIFTFVHNSNVIHRDIKPENIIIREGDNKPVLIDFGAVKEVRRTKVIVAHNKTTLSTIDAIQVGTPGYMPNEQEAGKPKFSSDVYALGIMAIQALTGISPLNLQKDQNEKIIWRNLVNVSDELAGIINKMIRYDFRQRYANAGEVLQALNLAFPQIEQAEKARLAAEKQLQQQQREQAEKARLAAEKQLQQQREQEENARQQREQAEKARLAAEKQLQQQREQAEKARLRKLKTAKADFTKLDQLLAAKNWKDADIEMGQVMLKIMNRESQGWLTEDNCKNFPREELKIIDQLWVHHSNGYYGFSVLKEIWTSAKIGGKVGEYDYDKFEKLGDEVGWRKGGNWLYSYSDLSLNKVPSIKGHFPCGGMRGLRKGGVRWGVRGSFSSLIYKL